VDSPREIICSEGDNTLSEARKKKKWLKNKNGITEKSKIIKEIPYLAP